MPIRPLAAFTAAGLLAAVAGCGESGGSTRRVEEAAEVAAGPSTEPDRAGATPDPARPREIAWAESFEGARTRAKADHSLIMVDFYTDWCGWCKRLDEDTYADKDVVKLAAQFAPVKLDAERGGRDIAQKYGPYIKGFPTVLFLDPSDDSGAVVGVIGGYLPPGPFAERMRAYAQAHREIPELERRHRSDPEDIEAIGRLAAIYHTRGEDRRTIDLIDQGEEIDPKNEKGHLTRAYIAAGEAFLLRNLHDEATAYLQKAARSAKRPDDIAEARGYLATSYALQGKKPEAIAELESIATIPGVSEANKAQARSLLEKIEGESK